jgi:hypothetical protein
MIVNSTPNSIYSRQFAYTTDYWEETMTNTTGTRVLSDVVVRVGFYSLAASVLVFLAMLLLVGALHW